MRGPLRLGAALAGLWPFAACADDGLVDQVENLDIEEGEFEAEGQAIQVKLGDGLSNRLLIGTTLEYGLSDRTQIGVELEAERAGRDKLSAETLALQLKWAIVDPQSAPVGIGIQIAGTVATDSGRIGSEAVFIVERHRAGFNAAANLIVETERGEWSDAATAYALRLDRYLHEAVAVGIEAGGGLSGEGNGSHFLGPVLSAGSDEGPQIDLGLFAPLSREAPALQARIEARFAF